MKIKNIKINSYGILKNKEINLENNINIIYGKNESGKSTLLNYIKNIFYGISKNKNGKEISDYEKYTPWSGEEFSGKIKYELNNGDTFEIYRDFHKKNPKVFNGNLEEISSQFEIDKKDGNQFFYQQTGIDENTYLSTIMSMQQEVVLSQQSQNILVQKLANLAGTGNDKVSFQKAIDKLNKRQLEEVGNIRTQGRPLNVVTEKLKKTEFVLKDTKIWLENKKDFANEKSKLEEKLQEEKNKNNMILELNKLIQENKIEKEKNNLKNKIKNENEKKINELILEKNGLLKNNKKIIEENQNKKNNLNNKKIFFMIFIILIIINILNFIFIKNKIINYIIFSFIPIEGIIFLINYFKNKKIKKQNLEKENEIKKRYQEKLSIINSKIELLENEIKKQEKEIEEENQKNNLKIKLEKEKIKNQYPHIEINYLLYNLNENEINEEIKKSNERITNYQLELNNLSHDEKEAQQKLAQCILLKEEYENLQEQLQEIEKNNSYFNLSKELLEKAYEKMKNNVTPKFTNHLSKMIETISNGKYKKVSIHDAKGLMVEKEDGEYIPASRLSVGTIDQLYLSLRLSMLDDISKENMPIILDEAFAYYDEERLENILKFLAENAKQHQVIILTCTKREQELLEKMQIPYHITNLA